MVVVGGLVWKRSVFVSQCVGGLGFALPASLVYSGPSKVLSRVSVHTETFGLGKIRSNFFACKINGIDEEGVKKREKRDFHQRCNRT